MTEYRYFTTDILTGVIQAELPLYGVALNRTLSTAGDFTGTFRLGTGLYDEGTLLLGSAPGRNAIFVERDGYLIWGGPIWTRTYAAESLTVELQARTYESVFDKIVLEKDFIHQDEDQMSIFKAIIDAVQLQANSNLRLDTSGVGLSGVHRTVLIPGYEYHFAQEAIDQVVSVDNGIDYTIDILAGSTVDDPHLMVRAGYPTYGSTNQEDYATYDYPGNIDNYWWSESAQTGATVFAGIGAGAGTAMLRTVQTASDQLGVGYPAWWNVSSWKDVTDINTLSGMTAHQRNYYRMPKVNPTFTLNSDHAPRFTDWNHLGRNFMAHVQDARFPNGKDIMSRMIGWSLQVSDSDNTEAVSIVIEGDDS